jgi:hypothetical protein
VRKWSSSPSSSAASARTDLDRSGAVRAAAARASGAAAIVDARPDALDRHARPRVRQAIGRARDDERRPAARRRARRTDPARSHRRRARRSCTSSSGKRDSHGATVRAGSATRRKNGTSPTHALPSKRLDGEPARQQALDGRPRRSASDRKVSVVHHCTITARRDAGVADGPVRRHLAGFDSERARGRRDRPPTWGPVPVPSRRSASSRVTPNQCCSFLK